MKVPEVNQQRLVEDFIRLVKIDSLTRSERLMALALRKDLQELGVEAIEDDAGQKISSSCGNIVGVLDGTKKNARSVFFAAHMDRVTPGEGINPQIKDGVITSDGTTILAADDVAGIVSILEALRVLREQKIPHGEVGVLFTISEEGGLHGAKNLDPAILPGEMGYVLDSGGPVGTIVVQAPSQVSLRAAFHGKAAHAGVNPEAGINALQAAATAVARMKLGRIDPETTANIGIFWAGNATNIICEEAELKGEARSLDAGKLEKQVAHMREELEKAAGEFKATVEVTLTESYTTYHLTADDPVVALAAKACEQLGLAPTLQSTGGGSDANVLNKRGRPTVVLGMGYENAHSKEERIAVDQLVKGAQLVLSIIMEA